MKITQIRNATLRVEYGGKIFIIDPWLAAKGECGTFADLPPEMGIEPTCHEIANIPYPLCDLPRAASEIIADADVEKVCEAAPNAAVIASHLDVVPHATITRESMKKRLTKRCIFDKILIPNDGQTLKFGV